MLRNISHIETDFSYSDFLLGNKLIDNLSKSDARVFRVTIQLNSVFDSGEITIGTSLDNSKLLTISDIDLQRNIRQVVEPDSKFITADDIYIYFNGTPSSGSGTAIIYYT